MTPELLIQIAIYFTGVCSALTAIYIRYGRIDKALVYALILACLVLGLLLN